MPIDYSSHNLSVGKISARTVQMLLSNEKGKKPHEVSIDSKDGLQNRILFGFIQDDL